MVSLRKREPVVSPSIFSKTAPTPSYLQLTFDYSVLSDEQTRNDVMLRVKRIKMLARTCATSIIEIGSKLIEIKEMTPHGLFMKILKEEFPEFPSTTVSRFMRTASKFAGRQQEVEAIAPSVLYMLVQGDVPDELVEDVIEISNTRDKPLSINEVGSMLKDPRYMPVVEKAIFEKRLEEANIAEEAIPALSKVSDLIRPRDIRSIARKPVDQQLSIARRMATGEATSVRRAMFQAKEEERQRVITVNSSEVVSDTEVTFLRGYWETSLAEIKEGDFKFIFADCPLGSDFRASYRLLAAEAKRLLKSGGVLLATVGHQNIHFIGPDIEAAGLNVGWLLEAQRRPSDSPRILGLRMISDFVPISMSYAGSYSQPFDGLVSDRVVEPLEQPSLEATLTYYLEHFTVPGDSALQITCDSVSNFALSDSFRQAAIRAQLKRAVIVAD